MVVDYCKVRCELARSQCQEFTSDGSVAVNFRMTEYETVQTLVHTTRCRLLCVGYNAEMKRSFTGQISGSRKFWRKRGRKFSVRCQTKINISYKIFFLWRCGPKRAQCGPMPLQSWDFYTTQNNAPQMSNKDKYFIKDFLFVALRSKAGPVRANAFTILRFLYHTQWRTTVGTTPLDEWSARRTDLYLTTHTYNKHPCPWWDSIPQS